MRSWLRDADAVRHIKEEELNNTYPAFCGPCNKTLLTEAEVDCHLIDVHGYRHRSLGVRASPKRQRDEQEDDWLKEEGGWLKEESMESESGLWLQGGPRMRNQEAKLQPYPAAPAPLSGNEISVGNAESSRSGQAILDSTETLSDFMAACVSFPPTPQPSSPSIKYFGHKLTSEDEIPCVDLTKKSEAIDESEETLGSVFTRASAERYVGTTRLKCRRIILRMNKTSEDEGHKGHRRPRIIWKRGTSLC
jgi:hypothetical protein